MLFSSLNQLLGEAEGHRGLGQTEHSAHGGLGECMCDGACKRCVGTVHAVTHCRQDATTQHHYLICQLCELWGLRLGHMVSRVKSGKVKSLTCAPMSFHVCAARHPNVCGPIDPLTVPYVPLCVPLCFPRTML